MSTQFTRVKFVISEIPRVKYRRLFGKSIRNKQTLKIFYRYSITGCGMVSYNLEPLIVNGEVEKYGESPWHVAIYKKYSNGNTYFICGGTIISAYMILSGRISFIYSK